MNPSNEPKNNNNKNSEKMSTNDISNRLQTLQDRLKEPNNEMGGRRRPDNCKYHFHIKIRGKMCTLLICHLTTPTN